MKPARSELSARYLAALRAHLGRNRPGGGIRAQQLGRAARARGLAPLDLAHIHDQALETLSSSHDFNNAGNGAIRRASNFFTQALLPLEAARRAAWKASRDLLRHNETLRRHTAALLRGNQRLEREITRRKAGEVAIRKAKERYHTLFLESQIMQRKLRHLTRQIITAQEEERKEISRELHDGVVQTLVGINVELSSLTQESSTGLHALKAKIARTQRLVEDSVDAVHRFARELRPAVLDDLGLIPALHAFIKGVAAQHGLKCHFTAFAGVEALPNTPRTVLYRVAQEALTNVARHAQASQVKVILSKHAGAIRMEISDNGRSFSIRKTLLAKNPQRLGLIGMKERVEMIGGRLTIESAARIGTTVRAEIPFN